MVNRNAYLEGAAKLRRIAAEWRRDANLFDVSWREHSLSEAARLEDEARWYEARAEMMWPQEDVA